MNVLPSLILGLFLALGPVGSGIAAESRAVTGEYRQLLAADDDLMRDVKQWSGSGSVETQSLLQARISRLDTSYQKFLIDHPKHVGGMVAYGGFLRDLSRNDEALRWWKKAVVLDPTCAAAYNNMAELYGVTGRSAEAIRLHQKAYELDPTEPVYRLNWANTCILFRKEAHEVYGWDTDEVFRRSLDQMRQARDLSPQSFEFSSAYAASFFLMKKPDWQQMYTAWQYCLGQPLQDDDRQIVFSHLARASMHLKRFDEARSWLAKMDKPDVLTVRKTLERNLADLEGSGKPSP